MHARHTQGLAVVGAVSSKTLVNRTRMKVVNIALTKVTTKAAQKNPVVVPAKAGTHNHRWS
jgi:hypothetical protein